MKAILRTLLVALLCFTSPAAAAPIPEDFAVETVATGFVLPISMVFHPDGRILVMEKSGLVRQVLPGANAPDPVPYLSLPNVENTGERGLFGMALDPDFESNGWLYLYYTHAPTARHRIARFTEVGGLGSLATEFVVWEDNETWSGIGHIGGGMAFGPDGNLYLATGDENEGGQAQNLARAGGKVIRIAPDGSIPPGNPFADGAGPNVDSIWARGLRNPFKAFWDLPTGRFFIGDVGQDTLEEIHLGSSGANFGWALCEGNCGAGFSDPVHFYPHDAVGGSVTMGTVYRGSQFPASYQGALFFADFIQNFIRYLTFDGAGQVTSVVDFDLDAPNVVFLGEGPDGSLYTLQLDDSRFFGTLRRITFTPNVAPLITQASASPTEGPGPTLTVDFSAAATDTQPITFEWFFGDGTSAPGASPSHEYTQRGRYEAFLEVSDGRLTTRSDPIVVTVGAEPIVDLQSPLNGTTFRAEDVIPLLGSASDPDGPDPPDAAFTWSFRLLHDQHGHPLGSPIVGAPSSSLVVPSQGHDWHDQTAIEVRLTVTDADGIEGSGTAVLFPEKATLQFDSVPSGLQLFLDGIARTTPFVRNSLIGFRHEISAPSQTMAGVQYEFESWSDGGSETHVLVTPDDDATFTASFSDLGNARVTLGQQLLYLFDEGGGDAVEDRSGLPPLDLRIQTPGSVAWLPGGGLDVQAPAVITSESPATRVKDALTASGAATLEAWITPANVSQDGPARILTLSSDSAAPASFMLGEGRWGGQPADVVDVRFRTSQIAESTTTPAGSLSAALTHVAYTRDASGETRIYLNGSLAVTGSAAGALDNWLDFPVSVANEPSGDRPWLGTLHLLSVYDRALPLADIQQNFAAGPDPGAGLPACSDGVDNDGDGLTDVGEDFGCDGPEDPSEWSDTLPCDDGVDQDGDGWIDLADPGCGSIFGIEDPACNDGLDNDGDGLIDLADPQCVVASRNRERAGCGLGFETVLALGLLAACRAAGGGRRR